MVASRAMKRYGVFTRLPPEMGGFSPFDAYDSAGLPPLRRSVRQPDLPQQPLDRRVARRRGAQRADELGRGVDAVAVVGDEALHERVEARVAELVLDGAQEARAAYVDGPDVAVAG